MIGKFLKRALAFVGFATVLVATPQVAEAAPNPALWEVSDPDTTIYLFGTIHLLPQNYSWKTAAIERAIARSDTLFVETLVDTKNPQALAGELARLGFSPGLPPIANRIHPQKRPLLEAAIQKSGIPRHVFDGMESWAAAFTLLGVQFKELGLHGQHGVEETLREAFAAAGKPVGQLETNAEQLGFFDTLPQSAQRALLEGAVESPQKMSGEFAEMLQSWASGDVDAIAETFNRGLAESPELREALLRRRNANWSQWIERRLAQPGTVLLAVGAGHLAGDDSVQTMLERKDYRVRRIQ
jgi:uncharacterized protein